MSKGSSLGMPDDQDKLLSEALKQVDSNSFEMKTSLDNDKLMDALKSASTMLSELRTSLLSPKSYYELFMAVCDQLRHLEQYLLEEFEKGKKMSDLYELVQYAGNIAPRLYLLVTVGTVYIKSHEGSRRDILRDVVEMCRGVQHPLRGLFLRNYLLQCTRNLLPDIIDKSTNESDGNVHDSISFILQNFAEMNKLWVRMQHQGHTKEKERREKERLELRILVGTNLVRLSELEAIDSTLYVKSVLPSILEQVVKCRDAIAQEYLMECIIQVFPDEFHLQSLNQYLQTCAELQETVNVKNIVISLIDRLAAYAYKNDTPSDIKLFDVFHQEIAIIVQSRPNMEIEDILALNVSLINLAIKCYVDESSYVDKAMEYCTDILGKRGVSAVTYNSTAGKELKRLLKVPIDGYEEDILIVLRLQKYTPLVKLFDYDGRKTLSMYLLQNVLDKDASISIISEADALFELLSPLISDQSDQPNEPDDPEDFCEEQTMVARLVHLFRAVEPDHQYMILNGARKRFGTGGDTRILHTLPPLIFAIYRLINAYYKAQQQDSKWHVKCDKIFSFVLQTITALSKVSPELSLRLYLQGALSADSIGSEKLAYEFLTQAFTLYEEDVSDSRAQVNCISLIISTFEQMHCLEEENHEAIRAKCAVAASRLLKKPDQCRCVAVCAHLFWSGKVSIGDDNYNDLKDGKRVMECLKKGGRIANQCIDKIVQAQLLVDLLNIYVLFKDKSNSEITPTFLKQLIDKINGDINELDDSEDKDQVTTHFENTINHLKHVKANENGTD